MEGDEFREAFGFEGAGVGDEIDALDDGEPEGDGAAEGVEEWEAAEDGCVGCEVEACSELADVGEDVAVAEDDAFGFAGGAGGEEERGFGVARVFFQAKDRAEDGGGEDFGEDGPGDDFFLQGGEDALDEDQVAVGWPGEGFQGPRWFAPSSVW